MNRGESGEPIDWAAAMKIAIKTEHLIETLKNKTQLPISVEK